LTLLRRSGCSALEESNHPTRWYPFAVTGINVTAFLIDLIDERLLDIKLYRLAANDKDDDVEAGLKQLHDVYGALARPEEVDAAPSSDHFHALPPTATIFTRFNKLWVDTNPRDVMAFPTIFQALKDDVRLELTRKSFRY
jgi:hypothetical protein